MLKECWDTRGGYKGQRPNMSTVKCSRCGIFGHFLLQCQAYQHNEQVQGAQQPPPQQQAISSVSIYEGQKIATCNDKVEDFFVRQIYACSNTSDIMFESGDFMDEDLMDPTIGTDFFSNLK